MDWSNFFSGLLGAGIGGSIITLYLDHRFNLRREKLREERQARLKQQEASAAVVEILSEWVRSTYLGTKFDGEARWRIQTIYWKNILLIDKSLLDLLCARLANAPDAADTNETIVQARRILLKLETPDVKATDLNVWPPEGNEPRA